jgi:hypothetical protein
MNHNDLFIFDKKMEKISYEKLIFYFKLIYLQSNNSNSL